jgi:hypothetical protein
MRSPVAAADGYADLSARELTVDHPVFITYRGEDSRSYGALLFTELARQFGEDQVFLDCESVPPGADFVRELLLRVRSAHIVLAVIGPRWLTAADSAGRRLIDDPDDWIRRELVEAFDAGVRVIPILTDGAEPPTKAELPADIAALSRCQARRLRRREPTADLARLVADLRDLDPALAAAAPSRRPPAAPSVVNTATGTITGTVLQIGNVTGGVHFNSSPE